MEKIIKEYQKKIKICDSALEKINDMIRKSRKDPSIDAEDLREEKANCNRDRQLYLQFIKDIEGCGTLIILDYLVDLNKEFGKDSSGRRVLRTEESVFEQMVKTVNSIK